MASVDRKLWQQITQQVIAAGGNIIRPWFTDLEPVTLEHGLLEIRTAGMDQKRYCEQHAARLFTEAAQAATGRLVGVSFVNGSESSQASEVGTVLVGDESMRLNSEYTFEAFVIGPSNRLSHAACVAVSESPGQAYNPLFVHGDVGLGKTHLLQATCHKILEHRPGAQVAYLSCETFVNHFIQAVETGRLSDFRYRYRHLDVLVIDDIQFLSDHEQTQEEFFHTFNTLYQDHKQLILSSDRGPAEIANCEDRLISRFNWGLVARIDRPSYETRVAILQRKARLRSLVLPDEVACFIAGTVESNIRELEGAIAKVAMLAQVLDREIDLSLAEQALGREPQPSRREATIEDILRVVTARYSVRLADLQSKKRSRSIAFPRQICMYLARVLTRHSLEEIGGYFGGRDHSTVLHAHRTIQAQREENPQFQLTLDRLSEEVKQGAG